MNKKYRKVIIAGNWKMNQLPSGVKPFVEELKTKLPAGMNGCSVVLCVPATHLAALAKEKVRRIGVGAQNVHYEAEGAFTGEISIPMLEEIGVDYCIVGHSERRQYFNESDDTVNRKVKALLETKIVPIVCVGENLQQKDAGYERQLVSEQVKNALHDIPPEKAERVVIAYEPIWAIGTGRTATPIQANMMCSLIRDTLTEMYGDEVSDRVIIQYGGSVKPENVTEIMEGEEIDGALVGGASLEPLKFHEIVNF